MSRNRAGLAILVLLAMGACASDGGNRTASRSAGVTCPPGETLICEVRNTGRITHGSFSNRNTNRCACEVAANGGTVIPSIP